MSTADEQIRTRPLPSFTTSVVQLEDIVAGDARPAAVGTTEWCAPEILRGEANYTNKVDVYSYGLWWLSGLTAGIVLWELITHQPPWSEFPMPNFEAICNAVNGGRRPEFDWRVASGAYRVLMTRCWDTDPAARPSFQEILSMDIFKEVQ